MTRIANNPPTRIRVSAPGILILDVDLKTVVAHLLKSGLIHYQLEGQTITIETTVAGTTQYDTFVFGEPRT